MKKIFSKAFIFLVIAALLFMHLLPGFETRAYAATYNVSDFSGLTSAISSAVPGDTININANINVTSQITISGKSLTINGNGYTLSVPSPGVDDAGLISPTYSTWRVFNLSASGHTITLNNMKIKGGRPSSDGGAIFNASGTTLNLNYVTVSNSGGSDSYAAGGIQNQGTVYMKYCSILRNAARYGGGFLNSGTMYIENTTFSENRTLATNGGGGAGQNDGTLYINNSTFANNYSTELGSAVSNWSIMHVLNSTFTGNVSYHSSYNSGAINAKGSLNNIINCFFAYNYHTGDGNSYTLADFANFNSPSPNIYYTSYHQASLPANATTGGAIYKYNGAANGSNNDFSAGGATSRFLAANGTQLGTGTFFQPFLVYHNSALPAVIKLKSGSFAYGKATVTAFRTGASPIVAYQHPAGTWNYRVGSSSAGSYIVSTDQLDTSRGSGSASDALGSTVENAANLKMVKIRANTDGSVAGGSIYGDVYPAGTQVTLTAYPNSGKRFKQWNDANNTLVSTQNPYTFTLTDNIELAPVYETFAGYTVTYLGNGNTEGQAPPPSSRTSGQSETIASKNTLVKTGYTFGGWNTLPTGLGTTYQPGDSHNFGTNTLLYAKWVPVTPPSTPSAISAAAGNAHATVSFTAPASDGGSPITHYTVKVFQNGNEQAMLATTGSATAITVTGLTNGLPYTFKVFATNSAGNSPDSSMSNVVTPTAPPASPSTPTAILAAAGNSQAYVSFTPPSSNGGSPITHYTVKVFQNGIEQASLATTSSATTITVTGLTNGLPYTFKVFATNLIGHSPDSEMSNAVTPTADITAPSAPSAISATAGDTQATVSFTAPLSDGGSSITHYTVKVFQNGNEQPALATTGSATAITVTGLTNGLPYTFKVFATNSAGSGPDSSMSNAVTPAAPVTPPSTPTAISAAAGNAQATVSFTAPASNGGSPITHYTVKVFQNGNEQPALATTGSATAITVTGLTNGLPYTFKVFATNSAGSGPDSDESNAVTPTVPVTPPSTPTAISAAAGNAQATVSFTAPASNGGSPITHYTVKVFKNGSEQPSLSTTGAATTIAVIGLENDVTYTFKVFATNSAGSGPDSDESNAVTPAAPVTPPVFSATVPDAPHGINAIAGNASAIISFRAPAFDGGTPVASYTVKVYKAGVLQDITARGGSSPITINGLANGARYTFRVYATNLIGNSPDSAESEVVVPTGARLVANGNEIVGVKIKVEKDLENSSYIYRGVDIAIFEDANGNGSFTLRNDLSRRILTSSTSFNISLGNPDSYDPSKIYKVVYRILYSSSASGPILTKSWETVKDGGQEIIFSKLEAGTTAIPANPAGNSAASSGTKPGAKPVANPGNPAKGSEASGIKVTAEPENIAASKTEKVDNRLVSTIMLDDKKIQQKIAEEKPNATFAIPFAEQTDSAVGRLNGQTVKAMEAKAAVLELVVQNAAYVVPAAQINIDRVSEKLGSKIELKDILVDIKISQSNEQTEKIVLSTAQKSKYEVVVKPVEFEISCTYGEKTVNVTAFNSYVERLIALPEGADPAKITTGIVLNKDGSFSHVPTIITVIDGRYYAKINSLTNSAYSVIYSPKSFKDCEGHWAKKAIDNMASRLVVSGVDNEKYEPSRDITRAEFSAIMARALGIMRVNAGKDNFADVNLGSWYYDAVSTAYEYGIIKGFGNGRFAPDEKITREQAMSMIARAMKLTGLKPDLKAEEAKALLEDFKDSTQSAEWAAASIAECIKAGVVSGKDGKRLSPKDNITRAEVAAIVERLLKKSNLID